MGVTEIFDVLGKVAEEEDVVLTNFAGDFNLRMLDGLSISGNKDLRLHHHKYQ